MFGFKKKTPKDSPESTDSSEPDRQDTSTVSADDGSGGDDSLASRLSKTRRGFADRMADFLLGKKKLDQEMLDELETSLLSADVGVDVTTRIIDTLQSQISRKAFSDEQALRAAMTSIMMDILQPCEQPLVPESTTKPFVILVVGTNGAGKTTSIGKLAHHFQSAGKKVMLAAGDTFRAAAVEQLQAWGQRNDVPVVAQGTGADPASVLYDAVESARAKDFDIVIADTAGRLHTQSNLMDELEKVKRVLGKLDPEAPHETLLVIDGSFGQNALQQAQLFNEALGLTGLAVTKLDGTAKGGILFAIAEKLGLPIRFIGVGEGIDDLRTFRADAFIEALLV